MWDYAPFGKNRRNESVCGVIIPSRVKASLAIRDSVFIFRIPFLDEQGMSIVHG